MRTRDGNESGPAVGATRRRWLIRASALTTSAALSPWIPRAAAQSQSTLNALPRIALVIGNTNYSASPLKNPANDAKAIAGELQKVGFKFSLQLDAGLVALTQAIQNFSADLAKSKGVGVFYYAGHGAQLAWRNYLIPVDANIQRMEDVSTQAVDLNTLLGGLTKAGNAMNIIILDACRDNPFGIKVSTEQKGLSQFDAPPGSLIAYATAPGNTAGDGEGGNGLYTENLLREIAVPEAKIEDVLKRVRLAVRRRSQGQQIPWETTSLEDDFYFRPPTVIKKQSEAELDRQFKEQKAEWDRIKDTQNVDNFYAFLTKYPGGFITEQAAFKIEQLQQAKITAQADKNGIIQKPYEARFRVGDEYVSRVTNNISGKVVGTFSQKVEKIENDLVYLRNDIEGIQIRTLDGGTVRSRSPQGSYYNYDPPLIDLPGDLLEVGKKWTGRTIQSFNNSRNTILREDDAKIVSLETVNVPAGIFTAYKIVMDSKLSIGTLVKRTYWVEPGWGFSLKRIREVSSASSKINETHEMVSRIRGRV